MEHVQSSSLESEFFLFAPICTVSTAEWTDEKQDGIHFNEKKLPILLHPLKFTWMHTIFLLIFISPLEFPFRHLHFWAHLANFRNQLSQHSFWRSIKQSIQQNFQICKSYRKIWDKSDHLMRIIKSEKGAHLLLVFQEFLNFLNCFLNFL